MRLVIFALLLAGCSHVPSAHVQQDGSQFQIEPKGLQSELRSWLDGRR